MKIKLFKQHESNTWNSEYLLKIEMHYDKEDGPIFKVYLKAEPSIYYGEVLLASDKDLNKALILAAEKVEK